MTKNTSTLEQYKIAIDLLAIERESVKQERAKVAALIKTAKAVLKEHDYDWLFSKTKNERMYYRSLQFGTTRKAMVDLCEAIIYAIETQS